MRVGHVSAADQLAFLDGPFGDLRAAKTPGRRYRDARLAAGQLDSGRPKSSVSHHSRVLRDTGLICARGLGSNGTKNRRKTGLKFAASMNTR